MNINEQPDWQFYQEDRHALLSAQAREWLLYPGSFMQRLHDSGIEDAKVHVIEEGWTKPFLPECELLDLDPNADALVREVLILSGETIWMFARSVFPPQILEGNLECLAHLKNRSLGSVLFQNPNLQRSQFEIACLLPGTMWYARVAPYFMEKTAEYWARRSIFNLEKKNLLLTEVFTPDVFEIKKTHEST